MLFFWNVISSKNFSPDNNSRRISDVILETIFSRYVCTLLETNIDISLIDAFYEKVVERLNTRKNARELLVKKEIFVLAMSSLKRSTNQSTREGATGRRHALTGSSAKSIRNVLHATTAAPGSPLRHRSKYELRSISLEGTKVLPWTARWVEILYFFFVSSCKLTISRTILYRVVK